MRVELAFNNNIVNSQLSTFNFQLSTFKGMEKRISPWFWIPTLYFAQGIPYFIVNNISVMMFTKMGVPNGDMAMFTSLLYLPWMIKPFWSPFVDIFKTKRWWTVDC